MDLLSGAGTAVIAAVVAFVTARASTWLDRRATLKAADAQWTSSLLRPAGLPYRAVAITNTGQAAARDVDVDLLGGEIDWDPQCKRDVVKPGETLRFVVANPGTWVARITWTSHRGSEETFDLFLESPKAN